MSRGLDGYATEVVLGWLVVSEWLDEWGTMFALALPGMNVVMVGLMCHCA